MKKINILKSFTLIAIALCVWSCQSGEEPLTNSIYITEAQTSYNKKIVIDDQGASTTLSVRLAMPASSDVTVSVDSKQETLDAYNKKYGTTLVMLPEALYTLNEKTFTVQKGKIGATELLGVSVKPFDATIDPSFTYAIPISIESVNGTDILEPAKSIVLILDQIIVTPVYTGDASKTNTITCPTLTTDSPITTKATTVEFLINVDGFPGDLRNFLSMPETGKKEIFCRFGNKGRPKNEFQTNSCGGVYYSPTLFVAKRWYHVAIVNTGVETIVYLDGILDFKVGNTVTDHVYNFTALTILYMNKSTFSEFRFWSKARTQTEVMDNMYKINPKTPGLELYWKINEGSGTRIKDHTDNGRDGLIAGSGAWRQGQRFPADK